VEAPILGKRRQLAYVQSTAFHICGEQYYNEAKYFYTHPHYGCKIKIWMSLWSRDEDREGLRGGWLPSYCISKVAVNVYMSVLACEMSSRVEGQKVYVNSFTPGYTSTTMTGNWGHTVEEGAMTGVWLALHLPEGYPVRKFWADMCCGEKWF
jgi:hypothetical protein